MEDAQPSRPVTAMMAAIISVAVLTAFAAWSPPSFRKLVLFSLAYGLCVGAIIVWAAKEFGLTRLPAVALTIGLTFTGLGVITLRGHQQLRAEQAAAAKADSDQAMARNIIEAAAAQDPELAASLAVERLGDRSSFADYLALRVKPLGEWQQPWPGVFWGVELLLAAASGYFLVSQQLRSPTVVAEEAVAKDQT